MRALMMPLPASLAAPTQAPVRATSSPSPFQHRGDTEATIAGGLEAPRAQHSAPSRQLHRTRPSHKRRHAGDISDDEDTINWPEPVASGSPAFDVELPSWSTHGASPSTLQVARQVLSRLEAAGADVDAVLPQTSSHCYIEQLFATMKALGFSKFYRRGLLKVTAAKVAAFPYSTDQAELVARLEVQYYRVITVVAWIAVSTSEC